MRNPPNVDLDSTDRLPPGSPTAGRSVLAPAVVPVNLREAPAGNGEELPFAPGGETGVGEAARAHPLVAVITTSRWRRPVMILAAVAVAASVALAAQRSASFGGGDRTSAATAGIVGDDDGSASGGRAGEVASQALADSSDAESRATGRNGPADGGESDAAETDADPVSSDGSPLQVTATTVTPPTSGPAGGAASITPSPSSGGSSATAAGSESDPPPSSTTQPASTRPTSTARQTTVQQTSAATQATVATTTTTQRTTTTRRTTTTAQTTTTRRTTTTVVLIGGSSGGFESPRIDEEMVWLDNGDVGAWRSTNEDIQLMRSGFEGIHSVDGGQYAELNSSSQGGLYRNLTVEPGTVVEWELLHRARSDWDEMEVRIGPPSDVRVVENVRTSTGWVSYSGRWKVPTNVTSIRFMLWSKESGYYGNLVDEVRITAVEG